MKNITEERRIILQKNKLKKIGNEIDDLMKRVAHDREKIDSDIKKINDAKKELKDLKDKTDKLKMI